MEIKQNILNEFLKIMYLDEVFSAKINIGDEGAFMKTKSVADTHFASGLLKKESFTDYESLGIIPVDNIPQLISAISHLGTTSMLKISTQQNELRFETATKYLQVKLTEEKFINDVRDFPEIIFDENFVMDCKVLHEFIKDAQVNKDFSITIKTEPGKAIISNTGDYVFSQIILDERLKGGQEVKFGSPLIKALKHFKKGTLSVAIQTDKPLVVNYDDEHYNISLLIAPRITNS